MKQSYLTVTDQFCGAGGSSQGVRRLSEKIGGGLEVKLAMNQKRPTNREILTFIQDHHTHLKMNDFKRKLYAMLNKIRHGNDH